MKITAVVVTYNRLEKLKKVIESVRSQTASLLQILVVNNGSTDGSREWLESQNDIYLINQGNLGGAGGFNTDITRQVNIPGYPATENATSNSTALGGTLQISQVINTGNRGSLIPSLGLSWLQLNQNSYSESTSSNNRAYQQPGTPLIAYPDPGKASYSLRYDNVSYSSVPLELALEFKQPFQTNGMTVIPRVSVGYSWDLGNTNRDLPAQFTAAPGSSFTVAGVTAPSSWWNLGLGLDVVMNDKLSLYVNGLGQLSPGSTESINYGGGFRWKF